MQGSARRWLFVFVAVLLLPVLAACGSDGGNGNPSETPTMGAAAGNTAPATAPTSSGAQPSVAATAATSDASTPTAANARATVTDAAASPTSTIDPANPNTFGYGFNVAWRGDAEAPAFNTRTIGMVQDAGFNWVRIQVYWAEVQRAKVGWWDPLPIDNLVAAYEGSGVNILATISWAPDWAVDPTGARIIADYADFQGFMQFMSDRYKGRIQAYEIWNEANLASTVRGQVNVADYARLLEAGYTGTKAGDPNAIVVFGGLTPTGVNDPSVAINDVDYLRSFYKLEGGRYTQFFDVLGIHANATNNAPELLWPDNPGQGKWSQDASFYFRRAEQLRAVMMEFGDDRPAWLTEFGWTTANQAPGYEYGADNTDVQQADYLVRAFTYARQQWPWVTAMFVWNLNYSVISPAEDEKTPWAVLNQDWSPRPAYDALRAMPKS